MAEEFVTRAFENDIADLARVVEQKRESVESENGIVSEDQKEVIRATLAQKSEGLRAETSAAPATQQQKSYLDDLSTDDQNTVRTLLSIVEEKGLQTALTEAETKGPYILDVFHDELTDKLYSVLKERGHIT